MRTIGTILGAFLLWALIGLAPAPLFAQVEVKDNILHIGPEALEFKKLARVLSEFCKVNIIVPEDIKEHDKIFVLLPTGLNRDEAWETFLWLMNSMGVTYSRAGKYAKAQEEKDIDKIPTDLFIQKIPPHEKTQPQAMLLYQLKYRDAEEIRKVIDPLHSASAKITTYQNILLITELESYIPRLVSLIEQLDVGGGGTKIYYWKAYNSPIADISKIVDQLFMKAGKDQKSIAGVDKVITDDRTNALILVGQEEACKRILAFVPKLDISLDRLSGMEVVFLRFAKAEDMLNILQKIISEKKDKSSGQRQFGESLEVQLTADKQSNALVMVGPPRGINELRKTINQLDRFPRQIFLEVVLMEVTVSNNTAQGLAGTYAKQIKSLDNAFVVGGANYGSLNALQLDPTALTGIALGVRGEDVQGSKEAFGLGFNFPSFGALVRLMQHDSKVNVLANPYLMSVDAEDAEIVVGSNVPFVVGSSMDNFNQPVLSVQRQDVALTVKIKPSINEYHRVKLNIEVQIEDISSISDTLGPTTTKRRFKTAGVVQDNSRLAIGGLLRDREINDAEKVPWLGDLPILGRLFRSTSKTKEKTNLMAIITPHIIETPEDLKRVFREKLKERSEYINDLYGRENLDYEIPKDFHDRVGVVESIRQVISDEKQTAKSGEAERVILLTPEGADETRVQDLRNSPPPEPEEEDDTEQ